MSKILQRLLSGEYPGLERSVELYDDGTINVEFETPLTNEIGLRFQKKIINPKEDNIHLQKYFSDSVRIDQSLKFSDEQTMQAWLRLYEDAISMSVFLPNNGKGFSCRMSLEELKINFEYMKSQIRGSL